MFNTVPSGKDAVSSYEVSSPRRGKALAETFFARVQGIAVRSSALPDPIHDVSLAVFDRGLLHVEDHVGERGDAVLAGLWCEDPGQLVGVAGRQGAHESLLDHGPGRGLSREE